MKRLLLVGACLFMASCIKEGYYTGDVVVVGKKASDYSNTFRVHTEYVLYGRIDDKTIKWWPCESDYSQTNVGDTIYVYDVYYREVKEGGEE